MLLLAGFLLAAPPIFFLGPLAGLLLLCGPRRVGEWVWLVAALAWAVLWLQGAGGLGLQVVRASGVLLTGAFVVALSLPLRSLIGRGLFAVALATAALAGWAKILGVSWMAIQGAVQEELVAVYQQVARLGAAGAPTEAGLAEQFATSAGAVAALFPAALAIGGLAGIGLAWAWHRRIAARPLGPPGRRLAEFRFSDHLVWGWIIGLGLRVFATTEPWPTLGANLLLLWTGLYAVRGLAVVRAGVVRLPAAVAAVVVLVALFFLPFVVGGLTLLGLADTWLDFRRRGAPPATGGFDR